MRSIVVVACVSLLLSACGGAREASDSLAARSDPATAEESLDDPGLAVFTGSHDLVGPLAEVLTVEVHPAGLLHGDRSLAALLTFTNTSSQDISIRALPSFAAAFDAEDGPGVLGVAGVCGYAWQTDGTRVTEDPCSAAEPVSHVPGEGSVTLGVRLFPRTESGHTQPGRYNVEVPLSDDSRLKLVFELRPHDVEALPAWPSPSAELTIGFEEVWLQVHADDDLDIAVLVEDPYRRELARRSLDDILASAEDPTRPTWSLTVPPGVWRVVPLSHGEGNWVRCGSQEVLIEDGVAREMTLLLYIDEDGNC